MQQLIGTDAQNATITPEMHTEMVLMSIAVLAFILVVLYLIVKMRIAGTIDVNTAFKMFSLVFIVGAALFLLPAGWSLNQISPIIGLLGTALGFVFGKEIGQTTNHIKPSTNPNGSADG